MRTLSPRRLAALALVAAWPSGSANAAIHFVSNAAELIAAINTANAAGDEDLIRLTAPITLTAVNTIQFGPNCLPNISSPITLDGGGSTLTAGTACRFAFIDTGGTLRVFRTTFANGNTTDGTGGGAFNSQGALEIYASTFTNNSASGSNAAGGAISQVTGSLVVVNSRFIGNTATSPDAAFGSAISVNITSTRIEGSTFQGNAVNATTNCRAGAVSLGGSGPHVVERNTFEGNTCSGTSHLGVGLYTDSTNIVVRNNTFTGNTGTGGGGGGGLGLGSSGAPVVEFNTFVGNSTGGSGGGILSILGTPALKGNAFAGNTAVSGSACSGTFSGSTNGADVAGCPGTFTMVGGTDISTTAANNGGPTRTHALLTGSSAIGTVSGCPSTDQRGAARGATCDAGAYQNGAVALPAVQFAALATSVNENAGTATISLTVAGASNFAGIAQVYVADLGTGSAIPGTDYLDGGLRTITIDCSSGTCPTSRTFSITLTNDNLFELTETIALQILATNGLATIGATAGTTLSILEPAATVTVAATDPGAAENPLDTGQFTVDLGSFNAMGVPIVVNYSVGGTAAPGSDYVALAGSASIPNGSQTATITVTPVDDAIQEPAKTVIVTLTGTGTAGANVSATPATVTITDGLEFPGVPTGLTATAGNAQATLNFSAPPDGGSPITGYQASCLPGPVISNSATSAPTVIVSPLANGTAYTCTVVAINGVGTGAVSTSVNVTPLGPPGAPTITGTTAGNAQATVTFSAPAFNGGTVITSYTATCGAASTSGPASPLIVTGLANGTTYPCTVTATNAVGTGPASAPANVTPVTVPTAPTITTATPGNGQITIVFTPPASNGGNPITGYSASCNPGGFSASGPASPLTVTGLANGTSYSCTVAALNATGSGPPSGVATATPLTVPGAPTGLVATPTPGQASIAFQPPASNGGSTITSYTVTCNPGGLSASGPASPISVTGLANGTNYTCSATATNAAGTGPASATVDVLPSFKTFSGPSATGTGTITAVLGGGGASCNFSNPQFIPLTGHAASPPAGSAPPNTAFPHGLFDFSLVGCTPGSTVTLMITYPASIASASYWKYGPEPSQTTPHWYVISASVAGSTVTFSITDGGLGDDDLAANGTIVDQGGPGIPPAGPNLTQVPTLSQWALLMLALFIFTWAVRPSSPLRSTRPGRS